MPRALVSVSDKRGVVEFARGLAALGFDILSTGGTAKLLAEAGVRVRQVSDYTGFPEMLDGRVKTLHPKIHGGLLGRRDLPEHVRATRRRLAVKVFCATACYDGAIADYLGQGGTFHWGGRKALDLRYGENPHQAAALYGDFLRVAEPLHGKELSYNNVVDIDAALALAEEFRRGPEAAVAILKHNTPCGVGVGRDPLEAWERAYATDRESPFGGMVVSTRPWTLPLARAVDELFTEVLIAPDFEPDALELLRRKKARRLVRWHPDAAPAKAPALRGVVGGLLVQDVDRPMEDAREAKVVTRRAPTAEELRALAFAWRVVKHVKSNAIAFTTAERTLALGGGQTSRVEPVRNARARAERLGISLRGSVLASDAFFPFADGLAEAIAAGATAVIQPGGSTRDEEVIRAADAHGVAMVFTGVRHFRH